MGPEAVLHIRVLDLDVGSQQLTCSAGSNSAASNTLQSAGSPKPGAPSTGLPSPVSGLLPQRMLDRKAKDHHDEVTPSSQEGYT